MEVGKDTAGRIELGIREDILVEGEPFLASYHYDRSESVSVGDVE